MAVKKTEQIFRSLKSVLSSVYGLEVGMDSGCILVIVSPQMCLSCTGEGKINGRSTLTISTWLHTLIPARSGWRIMVDHGDWPGKRKKGKQSDDSNPCICTYVGT